MSQSLQESSTPVPAAPAPESWLSPTAVAKALHIGRRSVYRAIKEGTLKASKVNGRDFRTCTSWINEWLGRGAR